MITFGSREPGQRYVRRPGAYGLAWQATQGRLLLVETADGLEIPGGGIEPGEGADEALAREFLEETGFVLVGCRALFGLRQFLTRPVSGKFYDKLCTFYAVNLGAPSGPPRELGHRPFWCRPSEARGRMAEECQEWILEALDETQHGKFDLPRIIVDSLEAWP